MEGAKILLVDDEQDILDLLSYNLSKEGYDIYTANNGQKGVDMALKHAPDLILLDVMMPVMDGVEACRLIREASKSNNPVVAFLTARGEDYSQIAGFDAGADDYITKPIKPTLFVSKVKGLLRRMEAPAPSMLKISEKLSLDRDRYLVLIEGVEKEIPKKEFELLALLASKPGHVLSRERILSDVWGDDVVVGDRTVDVHVRKLREKFGNDLIKTVKGVGYKLA